jgi:hypothetical protein
MASPPTKAKADQSFFRRLPPQPGDKGHGDDLEAVIKDPKNKNLRDAMTKAMADSRPAAQSKSAERGLLIRRNARGDVWAESYFPTAENRENQITVPQRAEWEKVYDWIVGVQTIGTAHSHVGGGGDQPSPADRRTAGRSLRAPGIIMSPEGLYYHGPAMPAQRPPGWQFWK